MLKCLRVITHGFFAELEQSYIHGRILIRYYFYYYYNIVLIVIIYDSQARDPIIVSRVLRAICTQSGKHV